MTTIWAESKFRQNFAKVIWASWSAAAAAFVVVVVIVAVVVVGSFD